MDIVISKFVNYCIINRNDEVIDLYNKFLSSDLTQQERDYTSTHFMLMTKVAEVYRKSNKYVQTESLEPKTIN